jgi:hypothetical protein
MTWIRSEDQLEATLRSVLSGGASPDSLQPDRSKLSNYFHQADGHVTERLLDQLIGISSKSKRNGVTS